VSQVVCSSTAAVVSFLVRWCPVTINEPVESQGKRGKAYTIHRGRGVRVKEKGNENIY
jgi:hypothetical protein